jgi:excinuclease UvrABC ATPase subunit
MIRVRGARTHNLKNVNVDLPAHKPVVITELSGTHALARLESVWA